MTYENIAFKIPNMTVVDGYFYTMDHDEDILIAKVDDGTTAFSYPVSYPLTAQVRSLEYDSKNFWSMHDISGGVSVKRWQLENNICALKDTFNLSPSYDSDAFTVEYYNTTVDTTISGGDAVISVDRYYDTVIVSGTILELVSVGGIGENANVVSVSGTYITLASGTTYGYNAGDDVFFYNNLWVFNNDGSGSLDKIDAHTGNLITSTADSEYDNITACTFSRVTGPAASAVDALIYVKGTSVKFVNPQTLSNYEIMIIDNIRKNNITIITVYDIAIQGENLYRLQIEGTYYETDNAWSPYYNYVASSIRSFVDSISVSAYPVILPANARNTLEITALITDQYGNGAVYKPVFFTDTDNVGFITRNPAYTDVFFGNGNAITYYRAGVKVQTVNVEGTATQYD